jgi:methylmalonyl-CoA mutase cobalamin-binding subunit
VARAIAAGFRASEVVTCSIEQIDRMLENGGRTTRSRQKAGTIETNAVVNARIDELISAVSDYDQQRLTKILFEDWDNLGVRRFITDRAVPFVLRLGENWQTSTLSIAQEHFASHHLMHFLSCKWRMANEQATGRPILLCTLPQDLHTIGLQLAAMTVAYANVRVVYLGSQLSADEIIEAASRCDARVVGISISKSTPTRHSLAALTTLRNALPSHVQIVCGGAGAPSGIEGVLTFNDLVTFGEWIEAEQSRQPVGFASAQ